MDDRYRPTTEDIRTAWYGMTRNVVSFDRWLFELQEDAWDRGYEAGLTDFASSMTTNPYRQGETE